MWFTSDATYGRVIRYGEANCGSNARRMYPSTRFLMIAAARLEHDLRRDVGERRLVSVACRAVELRRDAAALLGDGLHAAEIEERDAAVLLEKVIARVRIRVEHVAEERCL